MSDLENGHAAEVSPVQPDQWVIDFGNHSTEASSARKVLDEASAPHPVSGVGSPVPPELVDELGRTWHVEGAVAQVRRLGVQWSPAMSWSRRRRARAGPCPVCGRGVMRTRVGCWVPVVWRIARWLLRSEASAFVVDVFTRRTLGWRVTISRHAHLVIDAIHQADQMRRLAGATWERGQ